MSALPLSCVEGMLLIRATSGEDALFGSLALDLEDRQFAAKRSADIGVEVRILKIPSEPLNWPRVAGRIQVWLELIVASDVANCRSRLSLEREKNQVAFMDEVSECPDLSGIVRNLVCILVGIDFLAARLQLVAGAVIREASQIFPVNDHKPLIARKFLILPLVASPYNPNCHRCTSHFVTLPRMSCLQRFERFERDAHCLGRHTGVHAAAVLDAQERPVLRLHEHVALPRRQI